MESELDALADGDRADALEKRLFDRSAAGSSASSGLTSTTPLEFLCIFRFEVTNLLSTSE